MSTNPFQYHHANEPPAGRPSFQMAYWEAYSAAFANPNWLMNLLLILLCQFIPVVGPMVLLGYEYEMVLAKNRRTHSTYPDFDFGRFGDYLSRGVFPFLLQLIQGVIIGPVVYILMIVVVVGMAAASQGAQQPELIMFGAMPVIFLLVVLLGAALGYVNTPLMLRSGLRKNFGDAFDFGFAKEFWSLVGWETFLTMLFLFFTAPLILAVGALCLCVGIYPAGALIFLAQSHLTWQLYELYLSRGGTPIPPADDEIYMAQSV